MPNYTQQDKAMNFHLKLSCQYCGDEVERSVYRDKVTCFECQREKQAASHLAWKLRRNPQYVPKIRQKRGKMEIL